MMKFFKLRSDQRIDLIFVMFFSGDIYIYNPVQVSALSLSGMAASHVTSGRDPLIHQS